VFLAHGNYKGKKSCSSGVDHQNDHDFARQAEFRGNTPGKSDRPEGRDDFKTSYQRKPDLPSLSLKIKVKISAGW
jgi:hypothetical protein